MRTLNPRLRSSKTARLQSRTRAQLVADGVVASYIHDISSRRHNAGAAERGTEFRRSRIRRARTDDHRFRNQLGQPRLDAA